MKSLLAMALAMLVGIAPVLAQPAPDAGQIIAERIERDRQGVGIAVAILVDGAPEFFSHGVLVEGGAEVDEDTVFEIGSITKLFTNLLLAQLVLEGKMALDSPVADYLPDGVQLPRFEGQPITLFDLATHSAGLPSIPPELAFAEPADPYAHYSAEMLYRFLAAYPLPRAPGSAFEYSNTGTALLGLAISEVTHAAFPDLVQARILNPLGMSETHIVPTDQARFATGHDAGGTPVQHWSLDAFAPAGAYTSTARDLAKFAAAASGQKETTLTPAFRLMLERTLPAGSPNATIGLGFMILKQPSGSVVWHNGMTGGFNGFIGFDPVSKRAAVVLANQVTQTGIEDIGMHLIDPALPLSAQVPPREAVEIDPAVLAGYVGTYQLGPEFSLVVTSDNGRLFVQASGQERIEVYPQSEVEFFYRVVDAQITFRTGPDGVAEGIVLHQNGQDIEGTRQ